MSLPTNRVVFNRDLNEKDYEGVSLFMSSLLQRYSDQDLYFYVEVGEMLDLGVTTYQAEEVQWQARQLMCTDQQALISICEFDGVLEELLTMFWELGVLPLNRYVAQTVRTLEEDSEPITCIAKDEQEAYFYFNTILNIDDIITIREDNEKTL